MIISNTVKNLNFGGKKRKKNKSDKNGDFQEFIELITEQEDKLNQRKQ